MKSLIPLQSAASSFDKLRMRENNTVISITYLMLSLSKHEPVEA